MFPTYDTNPIAIDHMRRVRLAADTAFVDRHASSASPGLFSRVLGHIFRYVASLRLRLGL